MPRSAYLFTCWGTLSPPFTVVNCGVTNIHLQISVLMCVFSSECIPRTGIVGSCGNSVLTFNFIISCQHWYPFMHFSV